MQCYEFFKFDYLENMWGLFILATKGTRCKEDCVTSHCLDRVWNEKDQDTGPPQAHSGNAG